MSLRLHSFALSQKENKFKKEIVVSYMHNKAPLKFLTKKKQSSINTNLFNCLKQNIKKESQCSPIFMLRLDRSAKLPSN